MSKLNISNQKPYAGAKVSWTESVADYPASLYTGTAYLKLKDGAVISIEATANGDDHLFEKTLDASLTPGDYSYQVRFVEKADETNVKMYEAGVIHIYPDLTAAGDSRSEWLIIHDNLMDAYTSLSTKETQNVTLYDGTNVTRLDMTDLLKRIHNAAIKAGLKKSTKRIYARYV